MSSNAIMGRKSVQVITWVAPAVAVPALRYLNDPHDQRNQLFLRDASTYTLGALIFFATRFLAKKALTMAKLLRTDARRDFAAFLLAMTANILYAGIGAIKLSQHFAPRSKITPERHPALMGAALTPPNGFLHFQRIRQPVEFLPGGTS